MGETGRSLALLTSLTSTLTIPRVTPEHAGHYLCRVDSFPPAKGGFTYNGGDSEISQYNGRFYMKLFCIIQVLDDSKTNKTLSKIVEMIQISCTVNTVSFHQAFPNLFYEVKVPPR